MAKGWKGTDKVITEIRKFGADAEKKINQDTLAISEQIVKDAKRLAPVDNGKLQQNIAYLKVKESQ